MNSSKSVLRAENDSIDEFLANLNECRRNEQYCDVTLIVAGSSFPCHRAVLISASCYFSAMFGGKFEESNRKEIILNDVNEACFETILEFIYRHKITIDEKNSYDLLIASKFFDLNNLEKLCVRHMEENLPRERALAICKFARLIGETKLYEIALTYVAENMVDLSKEEAFLDVPYEILEAVVSHRSLERVDDVVLDLIVRWNEYNAVKEYELRKLLSYVNTGNVSIDYLIRMVPRGGDVERLHVCLYSVIDSRKWLDDFTYTSGNDLWNLRCRESVKDKIFEMNAICERRKFTLSQFSSIDETQRVENHYFEFKVKDLSGECRMLNHPEILELSGWYQLIGGNEVYLYVKGYPTVIPLHMYNETLNRWFEVTRPIITTSSACVASMNNLLYMVGGTPMKFLQNMISRSGFAGFSCGYAQCYDSRTSKWNFLPFSRRHINGTACSFEDKLYVLGGESNDFERFDPKAGKWETLKSSTYTHSFHNLINYGGKLWAIDRNRKVSVEVYDPGTNIWTTSKALENAVFGLGAKHVVDAFVY